MEASNSSDREKQGPQKGDLASDPTDFRQGRTDRSARKAPMTYFLKTGQELESMGSKDATGTPSSSTYGVQSLDPGIEATASPTHNGSLHGSKGKLLSGINDSSTSKPPDLAPKDSEKDFPANSPTRASGDQDAPPSTSRGLPFPIPTSLFSHSPGTESAPISTPKSPTSLKSLRLSDEDDASVDESAGQTVPANVDGNLQDMEPQPNPTLEEAQDAPQLVMPTMDMPRRRPFTEKGKHMGKLKIMVAGAQGVGKTSLIKSIVQGCEDIVHVDPLSSSQVKFMASQSQSQRLNQQESAMGMTAIGASTRPYPAWWSETKDRSPLTRRKSNNETVLERNVSFIDTPGFDDTSSFNANTASIFQYLEGLLHCNASFASLSDGELLSIFSGNGGVQVDLVLYIMNVDSSMNQELRDAEWSFLRRLCEITNVIPMLGKSDLFSSESLTDIKNSHVADLWAKGVKPFLTNSKASHAESHDDADSNPADTAFAISSAHSDDDDNMDASLLMSPDYVKPLVPSDLKHLISAIFDPDTTSWLRHAAAQKFINWSRNESTSKPPSMSVYTIRPNLTRSAEGKSTQRSVQSATNPSPGATAAPLIDLSIRTPNSPRQSLSTSPPSSPFEMARISDHKQREERLAQVHLARWASDLQRAMRNERQRFVELQQAERTTWLRERLNECADMEGRALLRDGSSVLGGDLDSQPWHRMGLSSGRTQSAHTNPQDPLGLLEWRRQVRQRAAMLAKVLGGVGIVGAVFVWAMKSSEGSSTSGWATSWMKDFFGE